MKDGRTVFKLTTDELSKVINEKGRLGYPPNELAPIKAHRAYWHPVGVPGLGAWHPVSLRYINRGSISYIEEATGDG